MAERHSLIWSSVRAAMLSDGGRTDEETRLLHRLREVMPPGRRVTVLADRGFGDQALYAMLPEWGWDFVIRFRGCIHVTNAAGEKRRADHWLHPTGTARMLKGVQVTAKRTPTPAVVSVKAKGMNDAWYLATSRADLTATQVVKLYGRRFTIEETFRDLKGPRFGFGLSATRVGRPDRRDRLILLFALTVLLLTLLGVASERSGFDRRLRANTVRT